MRAVPTPEQEMLRETATRLAASISVNTPDDLARVDAAAAWSALVEIGFVAMRVRDEGQLMASGYEASLVLEALGGALAPTPFLGALLAYELLALTGSPDDLLEDLAEGRKRGAPVLTADLSRLSATGEGFVLDGAGADFVLWLQPQWEGFRLMRGAPTHQPVECADLTRSLARRSALDGEPVGDVLSAGHRDRWTALALSLTCADAVGTMREGLRQAVEYAQQRMQYGVLIGSFQAVQHMCADMLVQIEAAASATRHAAWAVDALPPDQALRAARAAKAYCGPASQAVTETLMQVYGGIGQTWEHVAHLRTRRVMLDRQLFGDEAVHLVSLSNLRSAA